MEANLVVQQVETAQYLPQEVAAELTGELVLRTFGRWRRVGSAGGRHAGGRVQPGGRR